MVVDEVEGNGEAGPSARRRRRDLQRTPDAFVTMDGHSGELEQLYHQLFGKYAGVMRPYVAKLYDPDGDTDMFLDPILYMSEYNST
jgi:hypothetical protein